MRFSNFLKTTLLNIYFAFSNAQTVPNDNVNEISVTFCTDLNESGTFSSPQQLFLTPSLALILPLSSLLSSPLFPPTYVLPSDFFHYKTAVALLRVLSTLDEHKELADTAIVAAAIHRYTYYLILFIII